MRKTFRGAVGLVVGAVLAFQLPAAGLSGVGTVYAAERSAAIRGTTVNVRTAASTSASKAAVLDANAQITVLAEQRGDDGYTWYQIRYSGGTGYVRSDYVKFPSQYQHDAAFEAQLSAQGFPESYKDGLRQLHAEFPNWTFTAMNTGLDWNTVLAEEMKGSRSLVGSNSISSWKSTDEGKFDWNTSSWPGFDGASWVAASTEITAYYLDPRNFLNETYIFQFESQKYNPSIHTADGVAQLVKGTFLDASVLVPDANGTLNADGTPYQSGSPDSSGAGQDANTAAGDAGAAVGQGPVGTGSAQGGGETQAGGVQGGVSTGSGSEELLGFSGPSAQALSGEAALDGIGGADIVDVQALWAAEQAAAGAAQADVSEEAAADTQADVSGQAAADDVQMDVSEDGAQMPVGKEGGAAAYLAMDSLGGSAVISDVGPGVSGSGSTAGPGMSGNSSAAGPGVSGPGAAGGTGSGGSAAGGAGVSGGTAGSGPYRSVSYTELIMQAAQASGVSPYVLASMILQEQGKGTSDLISGTNASYPGIYNYFNIGAFAENGMSATERGLWYASQSNSEDGRPWNTIEKAIVNGAVDYAKDYVNVGQDTFYLKKWNVQGSNMYKHQYMTNVEGAAGEGAKYGAAYSAEFRAAAHEFKIPVYSNMPETACPRPTVDGNPNNKLSGISIEGFSYSPTFDKDTNAYTLIVDPSVTAVTVNATALNSKATIAGTGNISLNDASTTVTITVTAGNGTQRQYTLTINKQAGGAFPTGAGTGTGSVSGAPDGASAGSSPAGTVAGPGAAGPGVQGPDGGSQGGVQSPAGNSGGGAQGGSEVQIGVGPV